MSSLKEFNSETKTFDDSQIWQQLRSGEKEGLESLFNKFSQELFRFGMAIKPHKDLIKDCIQELFIDLWKYRKNLRPTDNVRLYLFKSLSNRIHKEVSKDKRTLKDVDILKHEYLMLESSVEQNLIQHQTKENLQLKLRIALNTLPARQKEVIHHLFFENQSYENTSKMMGINVQSVYTLAWKAISGLKSHI